MNKFLDKAAVLTRFCLVAGIVVVATLLVVGPQNGGMSNPMDLKKAAAEGGICASPGFLALTTTPEGQFYIIDTNKQVICAYSLKGDKLHLVSARKFDRDTDIVTGEIPTAKLPNGLENSSNGATRTDAIEYADDIKKKLDAFEKTLK